jgi:hypothetical protein
LDGDDFVMMDIAVAVSRLERTTRGMLGLNSWLCLYAHWLTSHGDKKFNGAVRW